MQQNSTDGLQNSTEETDVCPICHNSGWRICKDENGYEYAKDCECGIRQREAMNKRLSFANIPESFRNLNFSSFKTDIYEQEASRQRAAHALETAKYWVEHYEEANGLGIYMYSHTKGSGKTKMAAIIANELTKMKISAKFATSMEIINQIKATWDKKDENTEDRLLHDLSRAEVLIIDDFGTETVKDWLEERFYHIINTRYIDNKITLYTSNLAINELAYDERIKNRVLEKTYQVPFPEESIRVQIAKKNNENLFNKIYSKQNA